MVVLALLVVAAAVGATAYFGLVRHGRGSSGSGTPPLAASAAGHAGAPSSPLLRRVKAPAIRMSGPDLFPALFSKPPHAALVFDVDNGRVLARYKPYKRLPI